MNLLDFVDDLLQSVVRDFGSIVERQNRHRNVLHVFLRRVEDQEPVGPIGQSDLQLTRRQVHARAGDCFRRIANKHVGTQRIVHVVPRLLDEQLVVLAVEDLQIHNDHLVRVFDVHAKTEFFENPTLGFDHVVLEGDVILVEHQRGNGATRANLRER